VWWKRMLRMQVAASLALSTVSYLVCGTSAWGALLAMSGAVVVLVCDNAALSARARDCYEGEASMQSLEKAVFSLTRRNAELEREMRVLVMAAARAQTEALATKTRKKLLRDERFNKSETDLSVCSSL
jgi:hypothetical protein